MAIAALPAPLAAQRSDKVARIGILTLRRPGVQSPPNDALMQGLRDRGYVEGRNLVIDYPDAMEREDLLPQLAAELVRRNVDLILVVGPAALAPARKATKTIPLVMVAGSADPVAEGIAASLARPGGNVTGSTYAEPDRFKKQLELLKSVASRVARVAVLWDFDPVVYRRDWQAPMSEASRILGITIEGPVQVKAEQDLPGAFRLIKQRQGDAVLVAAGGTLFWSRATVARLAIEHRLPAIAAFKEFPQAGLLMSYGPDLPDINYRAAGYVDRILKGARPGDLPIELPSKFDLVINRQTAKLLDLDIPQSLLLRATDVVQ